MANSSDSIAAYLAGEPPTSTGPKPRVADNLIPGIGESDNLKPEIGTAQNLIPAMKSVQSIEVQEP